MTDAEAAANLFLLAGILIELVIFAKAPSGRGIQAFTAIICLDTSRVRCRLIRSAVPSRLFLRSGSTEPALVLPARTSEEAR